MSTGNALCTKGEGFKDGITNGAAWYISKKILEIFADYLTII